MKYQLIPVRMAIIKKSTNNKWWRESGEKRDLLHCWWEYKLVQPLWIIVRQFFRKLKLELPYDPEIPFLGMYLEKTIIWKDTCTPVFTAALFTIARMWKQPQCPSTEEQMKKTGCTYTMECYSATEKNEAFAICGNMNRPRDYHTK